MHAEQIRQLFNHVLRRDASLRHDAMHLSRILVQDRQHLQPATILRLAMMKS